MGLLELCMCESVVKGVGWGREGLGANSGDPDHDLSCYNKFVILSSCSKYLVHLYNIYY